MKYLFLLFVLLVLSLSGCSELKLGKAYFSNNIEITGELEVINVDWTDETGKMQGKEVYVLHDTTNNKYYNLDKNSFNSANARNIGFQNVNEKTIITVRGKISKIITSPNKYSYDLHNSLLGNSNIIQVSQIDYVPQTHISAASINEPSSFGNGKDRVLLIMGSMYGRLCSRESLYNTFFVNVNNTYNRISYGKWSINGEVTPIYNMGSCTRGELKNLAIQDGYNLSDYDRIGYIMDCGVNCGGGREFEVNDCSERHLSHEYGHTMQWDHAGAETNRYPCDDTWYYCSTLLNKSFEPYSDLGDFMGGNVYCPASGVNPVFRSESQDNFRIVNGKPASTNGLWLDEEKLLNNPPAGIYRVENLNKQDLPIGSFYGMKKKMWLFDNKIMRGSSTLGIEYLSDLYISYRADADLCAANLPSVNNKMFQVHTLFLWLYTTPHIQSLLLFSGGINNVFTTKSYPGIPHDGRYDVDIKVLFTGEDYGVIKYGTPQSCTLAQKGQTRSCDAAKLRNGVCNLSTSKKTESCYVAPGASSGYWTGCYYAWNYEQVEQTCSDGLDNDCDGETDTDCRTCTDNDNDGYATEGMIEGNLCGPIDCNDNNATVKPGSGCENFCIDNDNDGYSIIGGSCGEIDCDDSDQRINPGAEEICNDFKDNDCDGIIDDRCTEGQPTQIRANGQRVSINVTTKDIVKVEAALTVGSSLQNKMADWFITKKINGKTIYYLTKKGSWTTTMTPIYRKNLTNVDWTTISNISLKAGTYNFSFIIDTNPNNILNPRNATSDSVKVIVKQIS